MGLIAVVTAALLVGFGGGEDASTHGGSFKIVTNIDFTTAPYGGAFTVTKGSEALGCSSGTFVDHYLGHEEPNGEILKVLTCTDGERSGSFLISSEVAFERWKFRSGTGDFTEVEGKGDFATRRNSGELSGVETLAGTVRFGD